MLSLKRLHFIERNLWKKILQIANYIRYITSFATHTFLVNKRDVFLLFRKQKAKCMKSKEFYAPMTAFVKSLAEVCIDSAWIVWNRSPLLDALIETKKEKKIAWPPQLGREYKNVAKNINENASITVPTVCFGIRPDYKKRLFSY